MTRRERMWLLAAGVDGVLVVLGFAFAGMPGFGGSAHPYRDHAVPAAVQHATANVVSSVNFDQRGLDTLGEESILLASVTGAAILLRPAREERRADRTRARREPEATKVLGYVLLPVASVLGVDVVAHGHVTPGGGFQGGIVLATGLHLLYLTGGYALLERFRPVGAFDVGDAVGAAAFACLGLAGLAAGGAFLANFLALGSFGQLVSAGTVPWFNGAVGLEVASGVVVLLAAFLDQVHRIREENGSAARPRPAAASAAARGEPG